MDYRLFIMDPHGHLEDVIETEVDDDELAFLAAEDLADGRAMDSWRLADCVQAFTISVLGNQFRAAAF